MGEFLDRVLSSRKKLAPNYVKPMSGQGHFKDADNLVGPNIQDERVSHIRVEELEQCGKSGCLRLELTVGIAKRHLRDRK
jgi:hypothetical protein